MSHITDERLRRLEAFRGARFGTITEVDFTRSAEWNRNKWKPAVRVLIEEPGNPEVTCRVSAKGAFKDSGLWIPPRVDQIAVLVFQTGLQTGTVIDYFWSDEQADPPSEATPDNVVLKHEGHTFIVDGKAGDGGITLRTTSGIQIDCQDKTGEQEFSITHPSGTNARIDNMGNLTTHVVGSLDAEVDGDANLDVDGDVSALIGGDLDVIADGAALIEAHGGVTIKADTQITLQTLGALSGIMTQLTHPCCVITGAPLGVSTTVRGSA